MITVSTSKDFSAFSTSESINELKDGNDTVKEQGARIQYR